MGHIHDYESFLNEALKPAGRQNFWRLPKKTISDDLYDAKEALESMYNWLDTGNDLKMGDLENLINLLENIKKQAKKFKSAEDVKGTLYEAYQEPLQRLKNQFGLYTNSAGYRYGQKRRIAGRNFTYDAKDEIVDKNAGLQDALYIERYGNEKTTYFQFYYGTVPVPTSLHTDAEARDMEKSGEPVLKLYSQLTPEVYQSVIDYIKKNLQ